MRTMRIALLVPLLICGLSPPAGTAKGIGAERALAGEPARATVMRGIAPPPGGDVAEPLLALTLRAEEPGAQATSRLPRADAAPLDGRRLEALLRRLPPAEGPDETPAFRLRSGSPPPPRTGETVAMSFPPEPSPVAPEAPAGPLRVLRHAPDGDVDIAAHLSVTFSQAMVPLGSHDDAARTVPVRLVPQPPGQWRWLGTRTLVFEPERRFPMATRYEVEVARDARSTSGEALADPLRFAFSTPPPSVVRQTPSGVVGTTPVLFVEFDQRVETGALLPFLSLKGRGAPALRLATPEEIAADRVAAGLRERAREGQWIALAPVEPLERDRAYALRIERGAPSAEGPRASESEQRFPFRTIAPLRVVEQRCGHRKGCRPGDDWQIVLNNPIATHEPEIAIEPPVPGVRIDVIGERIVVSGATQGRTRYRVSLPPTLRDVHDQELGRAQRLKFAVGSADPMLASNAGPMTTLDPTGEPALPIFTINHERVWLEISRVAPRDWGGWVEWHRSLRRDGEPGPLPGELVFEGEVAIDAERDRLHETRIDLAPYLVEGSGQLLVHVEPLEQPEERWLHRRIASWVQVTRIGLAAFHDGDGLVVWASALADGAARPGVTLSLETADGSIDARPLPSAVVASGPSSDSEVDRTAASASASASGPDVEPEVDESAGRAATDADGLARIALPRSAPAALLVARAGSDVALLPKQSYPGGHDGWRSIDAGETLRWFSFDDRGVYRPGEAGHVKGWLRRFDPGRNGDLSALGARPSRLVWTLTGARGNELASGKASLSPLGGFHVAFGLPDDANLGTAWLRFTPQDAEGNAPTHAHPIAVREFRRPKVEVETRSEVGPFFAGASTHVTAEARAYAGGAVAGAPVSWSAQAWATQWSPPGHRDYHFGRWHGWWREAPRVASALERAEGETDGVGRHRVGIEFGEMAAPQPVRVEVAAAVRDVDRQTWASQEQLLVHPASLYVGLRTSRAFVAVGEAIAIEGVVADLDGRRVEAVDVEIEVAKERWRVGWRGDAPEREPVGACRLQSSQEDFVCRFEPLEPGSYRFTAAIRDAEGRRNETELTVWVAGGAAPPARGVEQEAVRLVPERDAYAPGDLARILVQAPFHPAEGLLTVRRSGLVHSARFALDGPSTTVELRISEAHLPNVTVQVDLVGSTPRVDRGGAPLPGPRRPAYAKGSVELRVPPLARTLTVEPTPTHRQMRPGSEGSIDIRVVDASGRPVAGAEVAVLVVDEAVLALTEAARPDPMAVFYAPRPPGVSDTHQRAQVIVDLPSSLAGGQLEPAMHFDGGVGAVAESAMVASAPRARKGGGAASAVALRSDFEPLARFVPAARTDIAGHAVVAFTLPDTLTRYRVVAVAAHGGQRFGSGESSLTAALPLMLRASPPRFANFGDHFALSFVLENQSGGEREVDVAVRSVGLGLALETGRTAGRRVVLPAGARSEVRFAAEARAVGSARLQAIAAAEGVSDATSFAFPIQSPATTEANATTGSIARGATRQPLRVPDAVWPQFGGLEVETSSTQLQSLTDAFDYLVDYPFACSEQIASRVLAVAALRDVLDAFGNLPDREALEARVVADLAELASRQAPDGQVGFWGPGSRSWPWVSLHVAHAFVRAQDAGFLVDATALARSRSFARNIESFLRDESAEAGRRTLRAFALFVRLQMGESDPRAALRLLEEEGIEGLSLEAQGFLAPVLDAGGQAEPVDSLRRYWANRTIESAAGAHFATRLEDSEQVLFHSERRVDAVLLEALLRIAPDDDLIPKLVHGLLAHRTKGRWRNTQESVFALLALDRYFAQAESETPDFVARVWLGDALAGEHAFAGRTTERATVAVPMSALLSSDSRDIVIGKQGPGRLYYRAALRYAPLDLELAPAERGFAVRRSYEAVDDASDVSRDEDGTWRIRAGARVLVRLAMTTPMRRSHVALVDPLPAGLEAIDPTLATSDVRRPPGSAASGRPGFFRAWFEHQNLRDERVEAFASLLPAGVYEYTYSARATTPGVFVVPPLRAEEMYQPETFGRSGTDRVVVFD